jgi:hypothetical protein
MADTTRDDHTVFRHETSDVDIGGVLGFGFGLLVTAAAVHVLVWLLFVAFSAREAHRAMPEFPLAAEQKGRVPPEPRLQTHPRQDLRDLRSAEDAVLAGYGWVDKDAGIARIPIDEAMRLTVQRGLPARQENGR